MSLLEAPETWIAVAAVLVLIAVILFGLAWRSRRASGKHEAAGSPRERTASAPTDHPSGADAAADTDAYHSGAHPGAGPRPRPAAEDDATTGPVLETPTRAAAPAQRRYVPVADPDDAWSDLGQADPARAGERAKDRLLEVLLADPDGAVDVVAALAPGGRASGSAAASLLRAGLSPVQVAQLCDVDEADLGDLIALDLGLIVPGPATPQRRAGDPRAEVNRTDEPGRAWASAGSASGSTTATTG